MGLKKFVHSFVLIYALWGISNCDGRTSHLSHGAWKGTLTYIAVDRAAVQEKLDYYNNHSVTCGGPSLFLPRNPVFPDILNETQHVLYVDFGITTVIECETGDRECCSSVSKPSSAMSIPLLTDDPDGPPKYSLAINLFFSRTRFDVPNINLVYPYVPLDEVTVNDNGATIRDADEEIVFSVKLDDGKCKPNPPAIKGEFEEFFDKELQFGYFGPDFSYCDDFPNNQYCSTAGSIRDEVQLWGSNVCQIGFGAPRAESCQLSLQVLNITDGFRKRWLLGENDPVTFVASESYDQEYDVDVKFPCA